MRQSRPSLLLPLLNRIDWHSMTSPLAESADTWSRTFSSEIPVSVAISESSLSPRSFRYFRISCKADAPCFLCWGCAGTPKAEQYSTPKRATSPGSPAFTGKAPIGQGARRIARLGGLRGACAGLLRAPLREVLRPLDRSREVLHRSFPSAPGLQHLGVSHMGQVGSPISWAAEWGASLTRFCALG